MKAKNLNTGKSEEVIKNIQFYLKHTKPDKFKIILRGLSKNEKSCRKIVQLYIFKIFSYGA